MHYYMYNILCKSYVHITLSHYVKGFKKTVENVSIENNKRDTISFYPVTRF